MSVMMCWNMAVAVFSPNIIIYLDHKDTPFRDKRCSLLIVRVHSDLVIAANIANFRSIMFNEYFRVAFIWLGPNILDWKEE